MESRNEVRHKRHDLETVVPLKVPFRLDIEIFGGCNFKCSFCPNNNEEYLKSERHQVMSMETFKNLVDSIQEMEQEAGGEKIKVIYIGGHGEPLLHQEFPDMISYLKKKQVCREVRVVSNGFMLHPGLNQKIVESGLDMLRISVEALSGEGYRKLCGVDLDFHRFVDHISDLYRRSVSGGGLKVSAKIVNATLKSKEDAEEFFRIFQPITHYSFIENVIDNWPGYHFEIDDTSWAVQENKRAKTCTFPLEFMIIFANGDIGACCSDWKHATVYGNIHRQSLAEAWNCQKLYYFQMMHLKGQRDQMDFCRDCHAPSMDNVDGKEDLIIEKMEMSWNRRRRQG